MQPTWVLLKIYNQVKRQEQKSKKVSVSGPPINSHSLTGFPNLSQFSNPEKSTEEMG